ncbi:alpha/beta hydrolase [Nonomuraea sp. LPB2021202275-12-8]|uniref:alpha/beta hydrolase n=1 Tax=Nonomuraea sp. LPB2021202275-12-8 TaxID=3120159 RepID=UPI00300CCFA5
MDGLPLEAAIHPSATQSDQGTVVYAHGITADLTEFGPAVRLADRLADAGFTVVRFSFRGHGRSGGTQRGMTVAGEMLDLRAVVEYAQIELPAPLTIAASSFGAVSTLLSLPWLGDRLHRLVLWRPVLDLHRTFIEPETPWGKENFSDEQVERLSTDGFFVLNGTFEVGSVLFEELRHYDPRSQFLKSSVPALVVHGDQDSLISYEIARETAESRESCTFHTVKGADHGFDSAEHEEDAIAATVAWLT